MTAPILTLSIESMGIQAVANLLRAIAEDYPLGMVEGIAGGLEIYPHGVGSRRAPFDLEEPPAAAPVLPSSAAPYHRCAVDGCGKSFPTRYGVEVHQRRMHKPASPLVAKPEPLAPPFESRIDITASTAVEVLEAPALPVSSYCRRGECQSCRSAQARCGHDCHPNSRQLPPGIEP
jgi:hypothetical protein